MPLIVPAYTALLLADISTKTYKGHSYNGPMLPVFALAVTTGVVLASLTLTGQITVPLLIGPSTGIGIVLSGSNISKNIIAEAKILFKTQGGPSLKDFADAIGAATQSAFALATLTSDANGAATFPSFSGAIEIMTAAIIAAAPLFVGSQWPNLAKAIATGICQEIGTNGTGVLIGAVGLGVGSGIVIIS